MWPEHVINVFCGDDPAAVIQYKFPNNSHTEQSQDLLGRTYEYGIAQFAEAEGKGVGEFYTPASVVKTLVAILKPFSNYRVYENCTTF